MPIVRDALDLPPGRCTCGIPSLANYHTEVILAGPRDETTDVQLYRCAEHAREWKEGEVYETDGWGDWTVLESTTTHLRGDE